MKKIFIGIVSSIMLCLFMWSPSNVKAADWLVVGSAYAHYYDYDLNAYVDGICDLYCLELPTDVYASSGWVFSSGAKAINTDLRQSQLYVPYTYSAYIPTLTQNKTLTYSGYSITFYNNQSDWINSLPPSQQPSIAEQRWDAFYDWWFDHYGYYPRDDSIIGLLRKLALGDESEDTEIIFPTLAPTPTPTPTPTPIPVQTIFVPDGNGNTTIIYQYPDPTTGVITQSPYNPNVTNNIEVNCDCDGSHGDDNNPFSSSPQDPYTLDASLFWADGFGVEMSDSPLSSANESQTNLKDAADEYSSSVEVMSNSFNVLPFKWLTLVGLLGGILIIAGLIRTFLGG